MKTFDSLLPTGGVDMAPLRGEEKVIFMAERDEDKPMFGPRRFQHVFVRRGEYECHFVEDLGAHPEWQQFNFPALGFYTVEEAVEEFAPRLRENTDPHDFEPIDMKLEYLEQLEEQGRRRAHRSTFGPLLRKER